MMRCFSVRKKRKTKQNKKNKLKKHITGYHFFSCEQLIIWQGGAALIVDCRMMGSCWRHKIYFLDDGWRDLACVAWRFCRAGRRSGVAAKFGREAARKSCFRPKLLPPQSPRGFSALARLHYLARPTKTAMLRRLDVIQSIGRHCCLNMTLFPRKLQKCEISRAEAEGT